MIPYRIEQRGVFAQTDKRCSLINGKVFWLLIKICISGSFYTHSTMQEIEIIQIKCDNLLFGEISLKFYRNYPLYRFLQ